jgi:hypothetical protein
MRFTLGRHRGAAVDVVTVMFRSRAYTFFTPPVISLPIVMPPWPFAKLQFWITTFAD